MWFASKIATAAPDAKRPRPLPSGTARPESRLARVAVALGFCLLAYGCSSGKKPAATPEAIEPAPDDSQVVAVAESELEDPNEPGPPAVEAVTSPEPETEPETVPEPETEPTTPIAPATAEPVPAPAQAPQEDPTGNYDPADQSLIVIEEGSPDRGGSGSLWEAAQREWERRGSTEEVGIVLTDRNLEEMAAGGDITVASPVKEPPATGERGEAAKTPVEKDSSVSPQAEALAEEAEGLLQNESYWRDGVLQIRIAMRDAAERIEWLEKEAFELRQRFYAEDDPFYRDGQIKPSWDRTLEELDNSRDEVVRKREELAEFLDEGRRAGALPGWLREGIELEPTIEFVEEGPIHQPGEPVVVEQQGQYDG